MATVRAQKQSAGSVTVNSNAVLTVENNTTAVIQVKVPSSSSSSLIYSNPTNANQCSLEYDSTDTTGGLYFKTNNQTGGTAGVERLRIRNDGTVVAAGFTRLGSSAPKIQTVKLTGTTAATAGGSVTVSYSSYTTTPYVLSASVFVDVSGGNRIAPNSSTATENYSYQLDSTDAIRIINGASASTTLSQSFTVFLVYES